MRSVTVFGEHFARAAISRTDGQQTPAGFMCIFSAATTAIVRASMPSSLRCGTLNTASNHSRRADTSRPALTTAPLGVPR
jgi:hypothetical protein